MMTTKKLQPSPNQALQRTTPCVTAPASTAALPPAMQVPRGTPQLLSLGSLGVATRISKEMTSYKILQFSAALLVAVSLSACALHQTKPRLLVTVTPSQTTITRHDHVDLTMRLQNIGDTPVAIPSKITKSGMTTINYGAGEWGLMSPNYLFAPAGAVTVQNFPGFQLRPGESQTLKSAFTLHSEQYRFPAGLYFADVHWSDQAMPHRIDIKTIPAIVHLSDKP